MITIKGASDDLIEIGGDIQEEFTASDSDANYLGFSDGTVLKIHYGEDGDGYWRITPETHGTARYSKVEATNEDDDYSDVVTLDDAAIKWVVCGTDLALADKGK